MTGRHAAPKRRKRSYEDDEFAGTVGRMITAMGRRAGENPEALALMHGLQDLMRDETNRAGAALHADAGFSLGEIAKFMTEFGHPMSRQAAAKRWGPTSVARAMAAPRVSNVIRLVRERAESAISATWGEAAVLDFRTFRARKEVNTAAERPADNAATA